MSNMFFETGIELHVNMLYDEVESIQRLTNPGLM